MSAPSSPRAAPLLPLAAMVLRGAWTRDTWRALLAVFAIALGVALGYAVQLITGAAVDELQAGVQLLSGDADLTLRGPSGGFDEATYATVAALPDVAAASPMLAVDAKLVGLDASLPVLGIDVFRAAVVQPTLLPASKDAFAVLQPNAIFLTPSAARMLDAQTGSIVHLQVGLRDVALRVAGTVNAGREPAAVMDIAGAQDAFDRVGRLTRIDVRLRDGVNVDAAIATLRTHLPQGVEVARPATTLAASASASRAYRVNMSVLALVALFTGALLVYSTQALAVVRRRGQLALLRVLGVTRARLQQVLLLEGLVIGAVGSVIGIVAGFVLAQLAVRALGGDLGSGYFRGVASALSPSPWAIAGCATLGVGAAVVASVLPARNAAHASPARALKPGDDESAGARTAMAWPGLLVIIVGIAMAFAPPIHGLPVLGYGAIALLLAGTLMLLPALTGALLAHLPLPRAAALQLALTQLRGTTASAAVSLAAIVASVSLMVAMAIMVHSFRDALTSWLDQILPADAYLRAASAGDTAFLSPDDEARLAALPGVRRAEFQREQTLLMDASRPRVVLLARPIEEVDAGARLPLLAPGLVPSSGAPPPVWVSEAMLDLYGYAQGQVITLPLAGRNVAFTVAGVWRDYARQQGAIVIDRARYIALTGDRASNGGALWLAPGAEVGALQAALASIPGGDRLEIASTGELRSLSLRIFDRTFAVTYALEAAAVAIGLLGLSSSFGALVIARRREFGVLRHLGMTRRRVAAMLAAQGAMLATIGVVAGCTLGVAISVILIEVVNRQSFHFGMGYAIPWLTLFVAALGFVALAALTAVFAGRGAMRHDIVAAVRDDW